MIVGEYYAARVRWPASAGLTRVRLLDRGLRWADVEVPGAQEGAQTILTQQILHPWAEEQARRKQQLGLREQCRQLREACDAQGMELDIKTTRPHGSGTPQVVCTVQPKDMGLFSALLQGLGSDDGCHQPHHDLLDC